MSSSTPPGFSIERFQNGGDVMLVLHGELDLSSADDLTAAAASIPSGGSLTLDLADLGFMNSSGLRVMMNLDLRSRGEGPRSGPARPCRACRRSARWRPNR